MLSLVNRVRQFTIDHTATEGEQKFVLKCRSACDPHASCLLAEEPFRKDVVLSEAPPCYLPGKRDNMAARPPRSGGQLLAPSPPLNREQMASLQPEGDRDMETERYGPSLVQAFQRLQSESAKTIVAAWRVKRSRDFQKREGEKARERHQALTTNASVILYAWRCARARRKLRHKANWQTHLHERATQIACARRCACAIRERKRRHLRVHGPQRAVHKEQKGCFSPMACRLFPLARLCGTPDARRKMEPKDSRFDKTRAWAERERRAKHKSAEPGRMSPENQRQLKEQRLRQQQWWDQQQQLGQQRHQLEQQRRRESVQEQVAEQLARQQLAEQQTRHQQWKRPSPPPPSHPPPRHIRQVPLPVPQVQLAMQERKPRASRPSMYPSVPSPPVSPPSRRTQPHVHWWDPQKVSTSTLILDEDNVSP
jgi:hypothetical protein